MQIPLNDRPTRRIAVDSFTDITPKVCTFIGFDPDLGPVIEFAEDLTQIEKDAVLERCFNTEQEETARTQVRQAITAIENYVALPNPSLAEVTAQVKLLSRIILFLARRALRNYR